MTPLTSLRHPMFHSDAIASNTKLTLMSRHLAVTASRTSAAAAPSLTKRTTPSLPYNNEQGRRRLTIDEHVVLYQGPCNTGLGDCDGKGCGVKYRCCSRTSI
jgi:hypothetical protein